jgi:hypothetical protein
MPDRDTRNLFAVVRRALRQPFSIVVLGVGALLSLAVQNGLPLAAALIAVAVYAAIKLQDTSFIRAAFRERQDERRKSDLMSRTFRIEELEVESRVKLKTIVKLQSEIAEDIANSPVDEVAAGLAETAGQTEQIVDRALEMAQKRRALQRYLTKTDRSAIESRIKSIEEHLAQETDQVRKSELEMSLAAKKQELADYEAIDEASARVLDQLDGIECAFSSLRARLVRIKSTDIAEWTAANEELRTELGTLNSAVDTLEASIEEALSVGKTQ